MTYLTPPNQQNNGSSIPRAPQKDGASTNTNKPFRSARKLELAFDAAATPIATNILGNASKEAGTDLGGVIKSA